MDVPSFIEVLLADQLAGSELTSWAIVHPTLWKLDHEAQVRAEKLMYRRFAGIDPFLVTATVIACFSAAGGLPGGSAPLPAGAGVCFSGMLGGPPIEWKSTRLKSTHANISDDVF